MQEESRNKEEEIDPKCERNALDGVRKMIVLLFPLLRFSQ
jgi:hypothetical protein